MDRHCTKNQGRRFSIILPDSLKTIGQYAFSENDLYGIKMPQTLESIGEGAFSSTTLTEITIPNGITKLPYRCFEYTDLETILLPHSLKVICERAFVTYSSIVLDIPEGVEEIETDALEGIKNVHFPSTLIKLDDAFYYEVNIEDGKDNKPYITVHPDNPVFYSKDGRIYEKGHIIQYIPYREDKYKNEK